MVIESDFPILRIPIPFPSNARNDQSISNASKRSRFNEIFRII